jgi:hypothetical protein
LSIGKGSANDEGGGLLVDDASLVIENVTIYENRAAFGGGIAMKGLAPTLAVTNSVVRNNEARNTDGGGIYAAGPVQLNDVRLRDNVAQRDGGGLYISPGANVMIVNSSVRANKAVNGGGIANWGTGATGYGLLMEKSTLYENEASNKGGALFNAGTGKLVNVTISGNKAKLGAGMYFVRLATGVQEPEVNHSTIPDNKAMGPPGSGELGQGGGVFVEALAAPKFANTIIATNTADLAPDVSGTIASLGNNLIGDGTGGGGYLLSDLVGMSGAPIDPLLSPLGFYGGPTPTHFLMPESPALEAGNNALTQAPTDQRGEQRIVGTVDIGAVEMQALDMQSSTIVAAIELWQKKKQKRR